MSEHRYWKKQLEQFFQDQLGALDALTDDEIDTSDSPPLTDEFFAKAKWLMPFDGPVDEARLVTLQELAAQTQELDRGY